MAIKPIEKVRRFDGCDLRRRCENDQRVRGMRITGDHVIVEGPNGSGVFPNRIMGRGLWSKVIKTLVKIGLGLFACSIIYHITGGIK